MASGQRLLADLLGLTTTATDSLLSSKLQNVTEEDDSRDVPVELQSGKKYHSQRGEAKAISGNIGTHPSLAEGANMDFGRIDSGACERVEYKEAGVHMEILTEKEKSLNSSERSQIDVSSSGSSERLPTPDPSDFIKSGVFVSSGEKSVASMLAQHEDFRHFEKEKRNFSQQQQGSVFQYQQSIENHVPWQQELAQPQQQPRHQFEQQPQHQQQQQPQQQPHQHQDPVFPLTKIGKSMATGLQQGKESVSTTNLDTVEQESEDVVVLRCTESQKKSIIQEKFKERMQNSVPVKKIAIPKIVKQHQGDSRSDRVEVDLKEKEVQPASCSVHADEAVSYAAVATSAAIAPFLQIQTALENQISSLVSTMNRAQTAEQQFSTNSQKQELKELESKVLELLDRRLQPSTVNDQHKKVSEKTYSERKVPLESYSSSDLQLIPTREYEDSKRASSPLHELVPPSTHIPLASKLHMLHGNNIKAHNAKSAPPRSTPLPVISHDKSTSPGSLFKRYLSNAKTQTSSSESSLVSEKSILETPLPRSKIPVPFARYTPNRDMYHRHSRLIPKRYTRNVLTEENAKERNETEVSEKENMPPRRQEGRRQFLKGSRPVDKVTGSDKEEIHRAPSNEILKTEDAQEKESILD